MSITIEPNVGKGAKVLWETVPNVGDTVSWQYKGINEQMKANRGTVIHRHFWESGDVTLTVERHQ
jgi:hypothetical protein